MAKGSRKTSESSQVLGRNIAKMRLAKDVSRRSMAKSIKKSEQQIEKYEKGEFVPLPVMEAIAEALDEPIPKKIIRKISFIRKTEAEDEIDCNEDLIELYNLAFPDIHEET